MSSGRPDGEDDLTVEEQEAEQALEDAEPEGAAGVELEPEPDVSLDKLRLRARSYPPERVQAILEGLLFVAGPPLPLDQIEKVTGIAPDVAEPQLRALQERYQPGKAGLVLHEVGGGWQFRSGPESAEFVRRFLQIKPQRLTKPALETLAVIAYRQPVTRPEIEDIRAVDCGAVLKALLERKLIKILGKKEEPGHPLLYGTTREFLEFFNLKNLASLPTLREFQELSEESRQIVEEQTGEKPEPIAGTVGALADPEFVARQKANAEASERALEDLEQAMSEADSKAKETEELLRPPAPPAEPTAKPEGGS
jgi:segregation and condensation protein B